MSNTKDINPNLLFINKKSLNSFLHKQIKKAFPNIKEEIISTNTKISNPSYNLISIDPKKRGLQKRQFLGLLHRDSLWKLDPNGRSTDFCHLI